MNVLSAIFGGGKSPAERLRQHQRALQKAQRELDRERTKLEQQEKKLMNDIKRNAKAGQMASCKIMAKDLVRTRQYVKKFYRMRTQLQAISLRIQTMRSTQQMGEAMKGATMSMRLMSSSMNIPAMQKVLMDFERESDVMDMKEETIGETVDDVMEDEEGEGEEEESDKILKEVFDEIGVSVEQQMGNAPTGLGTASVEREEGQKIPLGAEGAAPAGSGPGGDTDEGLGDLEARLNRLRKD